MERKASVFVCDELLVTLTGKVTASGIYTSDIGIFKPEHLVSQMVFFFTIETPLDDPFKTLSLRISTPGNTPHTMDIVIPPVPTPLTGRTKFSLRQPFMIQQTILRPGKIETTVVHDKGEIDAGGIWVTAYQVAPA